MGDASGADVVFVDDEETPLIDIDAVNAMKEDKVAAAERELNDGGAAAALQQLQMLLDSQKDEVAATPSRTTSVIEDDEQVDLGVTSLQALKDVVEGVKTKRPLPLMGSAGEVDEIIEEEIKRMKPSAPTSLRMPWEVGFAAIVLGGGNTFMSQVMATRIPEPRGAARTSRGMRLSRKQSHQTAET